MNERSAARLAWSLWGLAMACTAASVVALVVSLGSPFPAFLFGFRGYTEVIGPVFATTGAIVAARRPRDPTGWLFLAMSIVAATLGTATYLGTWALGRGADPVLAGWAVWVTAWLWMPLTGCLAVVFFFFPNGRLASVRWRPALAGSILGIAVATIVNALPDPMTQYGGLPNPLGHTGVGTDAANSVESLFILAFALATASLFVRYRRSDRDERQQLRWLAVAAVALSLSFVLYGVIVLFGGDTLPDRLWFVEYLTILALLGVPVSIAIAILKYRLYDLDLVINKAVVYGALAVFIAVVYVAIVAGIGAVAGTGGNALLSAVAAAVVALAFQPARRRAQRLADRLVFGKRATPYEVLSELSVKFAGTFSVDDALPRLARVLVEGTGARSVLVWLRVGGTLQPTGAWPPDRERPGPIPVASGDLSLLPGDLTVPVVHQDELLGAITIEMPPSEQLGPSEERLVQDVAAQAGLVLRNVSLVEDLRASRKRIVAAQDDRARAIERNIHDGAQQQLVALAVKLKLVKSLLSKDVASAAAMLDDLGGEAQGALENLRDLARGIYPPLLADKGLGAAIESQTRKSPVPTTVDVDGVGRYSQDVEAAVYFSTLEALQNVAKYAQASHAEVRVAQRDGTLWFAVTDDGRGFDPAATAFGTGLHGIADRLAAIGGEVTVRSAPGAGTSVEGSVPAGPEDGR